MKRPNLILRASAGTGKTHRLAVEYLDRIGPETLPRIVLVTFNDNAAAELRMRISQGIRRRLHCDVDNIEALVLTRDRLPEARVSTLHTMCRTLLSEYGTTLPLGPDPIVLDDRESADWMEESITTAVLSSLRGGDRLLAALLRETPLRRRRTYGNGFVEAVREAIERIRSRSLRPDAVAVPEPPTRGDFLALEPMLDDLGVARARERLEAAFKSLSGDPEGIATADAFLTELREDAGDARGNRGKIVKELRARIADLRLRIRTPLIERIVGILEEGMRMYAERKRATGRIDFDDMIEKVVELTERPEILGEIRSGIDEILLDEAQDLSGLQVRLVLRLWDPGSNRLVVCGDRKQSIYGWRNADPTVMDRLEAAIEDSPASATEKLDRSYRSSGRIVDFVNAYSPLVLGEAYDRQNDPLRAHRGAIDADAPPAVEILDGGADPDADTAAAARIEADAIARRILALTSPAADRAEWGGPLRWVRREKDGSLVLDRPDSDRRFRYEDIAVLYRWRTHQGALERALRRYGIPYAVERGIGIAQCQEVADLLHLLSFLSDPDDALSLAGALRSPLFGISDATLFDLSRRGLLGRAFLDVPFRAPPELDETRRRTVERAASLLRKWRDRLASAPLAGLLETIVQETAVGAVHGALPQGEQRLANLRRLIEMARDFDAGRGSGPAVFLRRILEAARDPVPDPQPQIVGGQRNVVRIMTIHQAKGLTFRVAVVPQFGREIRSPRLPPLVAGKDDEGEERWIFHFKGADGQTILDEHPLGRKLRDEERDRANREEMRLIYVAITRAQDMLILSVPPRNPARKPPRHLESLLELAGNSPKILRRVPIRTIPVAEAAVEDVAWERSGFPEVDASERDRIAKRARRGSPAVAPTGRETVGVTSLLRLERCRRWFWLSTVAGLRPRDDFLREEIAGAEEEEPEEGTEPKPAANEFGTAGHAVLERIPLDDPDRWEEEIRRGAERELAGEAERDRLVEALGHVAEKFLPRIVSSRVDREIPFLHPVTDRLAISGVIDLLIRSNDRACEIVDYKFSHADPEILLEQYSGQLLTYAVCAAAAGLAPRRATLVQALASECREIDVPLTKGKIESRREELATLGREIPEIRAAETVPDRIDAFGHPLKENRCRGVLHCLFADLCWNG